MKSSDPGAGIWISIIQRMLQLKGATILSLCSHVASIPPRMSRLSKIHKVWLHLMSIVRITGSPTYALAKRLAHLLDS